MPCPDCISFGNECNPEPEDYDKPCSCYKSREEVLEAEMGYELELSQRREARDMLNNMRFD